MNSPGGDLYMTFQHPLHFCFLPLIVGCRSADKATFQNETHLNLSVGGVHFENIIQVRLDEKLMFIDCCNRCETL